MTNTLQKIMHNGDEYLIPQYSVIRVTLTANGWSNDEQTVTATGVTATNTVVISPVPTSMSYYTSGGVYYTAQGTDSLTFECTTTPSNDIDVNVVIFEEAEAPTPPTPGWQPGPNTVAYFPMSSNLTDVISSNSLTGNCTFGTIGGSAINCAITTSNGLSGTGASLPQGTNPRTVSMWFYFDGSNSNEGGTVFYGTPGTNNQVFGAYSEPNNGNWKISLSQRGANSGYKYTWTTGSWYLITMTYDSNKDRKLYINGTYAGYWNYNIGTTGNNILLGNLIWNTGDYLYGGFSNLIIENVAWSAQDVSDYYDLTKGDYGIS